MKYYLFVLSCYIFSTIGASESLREVRQNSITGTIRVVDSQGYNWCLKQNGLFFYIDQRGFCVFRDRMQYFVSHCSENNWGPLNRLDAQSDFAKFYQDNAERVRVATLAYQRSQH